MVTLNWLFCMGYLLTGYYFKLLSGTTKLTWTMPQCVLTLSLIGLSFDVYDGEENKKLDKRRKPDQVPLSSKDAKFEDTALPQVPSLLTILSKVFFPQTFLVGPQLKFNDYLQFIEENHESQLAFW